MVSATSLSNSRFTLAYRRYALVVMTAVLTLNFVDRGLIKLLLQPIKQDLQLTDTQLGLLTGVAFGVFYATLGLPIARWADRGNRVTITSLAIGLWGLTVMSCLLVTNFVQLVLARIAAAVGEAGCHPPTYSLVGDYFPQPAERTRAMAVYLTGGPLSALFSFAIGGWLNELYGWRMTFFLMGIPGLILALVFAATVTEPRMLGGRSLAAPMPLPPMAVVMSTLWNHQSLRNLTIAMIFLYTMGMGLSPWYAAYLIRTHAMGTGELGIWMGLIYGLGGMGSVLLGSFIASRWFVGNERAQMQMNALAVASLVPTIMTLVMTPNKYVALFSLLPLIAAFNIFLGPIYTLMQRLVPDDMRATMMSVVMLLANLIGMGVGPLILGILSDVLASIEGKDALGHAMMIMSLVAGISSYYFWSVGTTVQNDLAKVATPANAKAITLAGAG